MSDLQRDIDLIDSFLDSQDSFGGYLYAPQRYVWQRIRARLTPDRERVARAIDVALNGALLHAEAFDAADAAIAAMGEKE